MDQQQMSQTDSDTGTRDSTYNLVAVLYHALQGVENTGIYLADAKQDQRQLLQMAHDTQKQIAEQAKRQLHDALMREIGGGGTGNERPEGLSDIGSNQSGRHAIPQPTSFEQARDDDSAFRFASSDTAGGTDQFASRQDGDQGSGQDRMTPAGSSQSNDEATRAAGHGVGSRLSNTEATTGGGGTSTF